ncbi:MAG: hypothetical protein ABR575_09590 [Actinomycetota bacterium]
MILSKVAKTLGKVVAILITAASIIAGDYFVEPLTSPVRAVRSPFTEAYSPTHP